MKKLISVLLVIGFFITACGAPMVIKDKKYEPYGLLNKSRVEDPKMDYQFVWIDVMWSVLFYWTVAVPVYCIGFDMWEPVGLREVEKGKK